MADASKNAASGGGTLGFAVVLLVLAASGAGAGFSLKFVMPNGSARSEASTSNAGGKEEMHSGTSALGAESEKPTARTEREIGNDQLVALEPIVVTLAEPKGVRLRIEASVIFAKASKEDRGLLMREMTEDLMAFLRTTPLAQIETASGLEYLREDMTELVQLRSKGGARGLVIRALMVE